VTTERPEPPLVGDERQMLRVFLDYHRATLAMTCDGLIHEYARHNGHADFLREGIDGTVGV
jgi:Protein of unknown function (DUF664)